MTDDPKDLPGLHEMLANLPRARLTPKNISQTTIDRWYSAETKYLAELNRLRKEVETFRAPPDWHNTDHRARILDVLTETITEMAGRPAEDVARQVMIYSDAAISAVEREQARTAGIAAALHEKRESAVQAWKDEHLALDRVTDELRAAEGERDRLRDFADAMTDQRDRLMTAIRGALEIYAAHFTHLKIDHTHPNSSCDICLMGLVLSKAEATIATLVTPEETTDGR